MSIVITDLTKRLRRRVILDHINVTFDAGKIHGIVGHNGSGKTMLFRAVSGLMHPTSGTISYNGKQLYKDMETLPSLGIILENADLYPEYSAVKNLTHLAGIRAVIDDETVRESIYRVGLDPDDRRPYRKYSLGMKQRLKIAQAIMEKPNVLILDEPTNSLDPEGIELLYKLLDEERERGTLVLVASHQLAEISDMADHVYRMDAGKLREVDDV